MILKLNPVVKRAKEVGSMGVISEAEHDLEVVDNKYRGLLMGKNLERS